MNNTESLLLAERKQLEEMIAETSDERATEKGSLQARLRVVNRDLFFVREVARRNAELKQTADCKEIEEAREEFGKLFEPQEIDKLKQRVAELEAINKKLMTLLRDIDEELSRAQADALETGNMTGSSLPAKLRVRLFAEIKKAKGELQ